MNKNFSDQFFHEIVFCNLVVPHVQINRDDNSLLREKIISMSPEERKKLGINKSTLWYLKKNIQSKDKIKIYDKILDKMKDTMS